MGRIIRDNTRFHFTKETALAIGTLFLYWAGYYLDNSGFFGESMIWLIIWGIGFGIILNVCLPAWWIVKKKREGFAGMGITTKKFGLALVLGVLLGSSLYDRGHSYIATFFSNRIGTSHETNTSM